MAIELSNPQPARTVRTAHPVVLASASPRRSSILRQIGFEFDAVPADIDESMFRDLGPAQLAQRLAESKAERIGRDRADCCVIAADTVVAFEGRSVGKPENAGEAIAMLQSLSGKTHEVHTGVALSAAGVVSSGVETTGVSMRSLEKPEIEAYVRSGAALDKAGAYGIQDSQFSPVDSYQGSYSNVVGLPVVLLARLLLEAAEIDEGSASLISRSDAL